MVAASGQSHLSLDEYVAGTVAVELRPWSTLSLCFVLLWWWTAISIWLLLPVVYLFLATVQARPLDSHVSVHYRPGSWSLQDGQRRRS